MILEYSQVKHNTDILHACRIIRLSIRDTNNMETLMSHPSPNSFYVVISPNQQHTTLSLLLHLVALLHNIQLMHHACAFIIWFLLHPLSLSFFCHIVISKSEGPNRRPNKGWRWVIINRIMLQQVVEKNFCWLSFNILFVWNSSCDFSQKWRNYFVLD